MTNRARLAFLPLLTVLTWSAAYAAQDPQTGHGDPLIRYAPYDAGTVYRITSTGLSPVELVFSDGEQPVLITGVLVSADKKSARDWFAFHHDDVLVLQPLHEMAPSILFVSTDGADGKPGKNYTFELQTRTGNVAQPDGQTYVQVNMTYPAQEAAERAAAWRARVATAREKAAQARLAQSQLAGRRNWRYLAQGSTEIQPINVSDDGQNTMMLFPPHAALPVPYIINQDGRESVVQATNQNTQDGLLVILHVTSREIVLRRGQQVCALYNQGYDPIGTTPGTGTSSPDVVREVSSR
jgi:type IV secretion system protein VirB9